MPFGWRFDRPALFVATSTAPGTTLLATAFRINSSNVSMAVRSKLRGVEITESDVIAAPGRR